MESQTITTKTSATVTEKKYTMKILNWLLGSACAERMRSTFCFKKGGSIIAGKINKKEEVSKGAAVGIAIEHFLDIVKNAKIVYTDENGVTKEYISNNPEIKKDDKDMSWFISGV